MFFEVIRYQENDDRYKREEVIEFEEEWNQGALPVVFSFASFRVVKWEFVI
jgi:hypothetical protein